MRISLTNIEIQRVLDAKIGEQKEALRSAIDTMDKYQRIQAIINNAKDSDGAVKYN